MRNALIIALPFLALIAMVLGVFLFAHVEMNSVENGILYHINKHFIFVPLTLFVLTMLYLPRLPTKEV